MRRALLSFTLLAASLAALAPEVARSARPKRNVPEEAPAAPAAEVPKLKGRLFPGALPADIGPVPAGLHGLSAQGCNACHPAAVSRWSQSAHARPPSATLIDAAAGEQSCLSCHLPLQSQWERPSEVSPEAAAAPSTFNATLLAEGVTCAACHVRDGAVIVASEAVAARSASTELPRMPHQSKHSAELSSSEACAPCHQLALPGGEAPLYDTYGQWKRSGFEAIGITCQSCHATGAADGSIGAEHDMDIDPARGLTLDLGISTLEVVRGAEALPFSVTLTNTGAGHNIPTGTPFRGMRLEVRLEGPPSPDGRIVPDTLLLSYDLQRKVQEKAPFAVVSDTTLEAGKSQRVEGKLALGIDAEGGPRVLRITVARTLQGEISGSPFIDRRWPLTVE